MTASEPLSHLNDVRSRGTGRYSARCQADADNSPSLAITEGERGLVVIVMGLNGVISIKLIADESATEERLRDILRSMLPILETLHKTVSPLTYEPAGARG